VTDWRIIAAMLARISAFTHRGRVRRGNEDTVVVDDWVHSADMAAPRESSHTLSVPLLVAVADGMGGHSAGEVASRLTAERLVTERVRLTDPRSAATALEAIDAGLYRAMERDPELVGMGTTVVGLLLGARRLLWFNVGDSRLYRLGDGKLTQLSVDDSPPGPRSGVLTQSLGGALPRPGITPHVGEAATTAPARFLLCSDGLTDMVEEQEIADCLTLTDRAAVTQLFDFAMAAGGHDNVSIVLVSVE
jgi:serine/threonine protein phosphatase PrpC